MSLADGKSSRPRETGTSAPSTHPSPDPQNGTTPIVHDPENPRSAESSCHKRQSQNEAARRGSKPTLILAYVIPMLYRLCLGIFALLLLRWFGVFAPPVSDFLGGVFTIIFTVINAVTLLSAWRNKNKRCTEFATSVALSTITAALFLALPLILLSVTFRKHSSLKQRVNAGLETWKWLEIAFVCCVFCIIWRGCGVILTLVVRKYGRHNDLAHLAHISMEGIVCFSFIVAEVFIVGVAPSVKSVTFFGLESWKWIVSLAAVLCGLCVIRFITRLIVLGLEKMENKLMMNLISRKEEMERNPNMMQATIKYAAFMAKGLRRRINLLLLFILIVLIWINYVSPRLQLEKSSGKAKNGLDIAIRCFLSLSIGAVLSLVKKFLLLLWEARELCKRKAERIFDTFKQLYFLAKVGGSGWDLFGQQRGQGDRKAVTSSTEDVGQRSEMSDRDKEIEERKRLQKKQGDDKLRQILQAANDNFISYDMPKTIAQLFLKAEQKLADDTLDELRDQWEKHHRAGGVRDRIMTRDNLINCINQVYKYQLDRDEADCLHNHLKPEDPSSIRYKDFEEWMIKAQKGCTRLGNTFSGAIEMVNCLNKILIGLIIALCIIICLFFTKIATTELFVLVASPLVAATVIFGETAKTVFQGLIFAFAVHPFDVGDICVIGENQLEVKKIRIWKTTFYKKGCIEEEVQYPNSILIKLPIIKQERAIDLQDSVEFKAVLNLSSYSVEEEKAIEVLREKINTYLEGNEDLQPGSGRVFVKDIEEVIKLEVRFKHKKYIQYMAQSERLKKMDETRSQLLIAIRKFIDQAKAQNLIMGSHHTDNKLFNF